MASYLERLSLMAGITLTESQLNSSRSVITERKLTPAELKKREEVAAAIERDQPGINKSKKMAIATAQAKKMSEAKTGSNKVFDSYSTWKAAAEKAGCEIFASGAATGKYEARMYSGTKAEICGRFDKNEKDGWLHSSVISEDVNYDEEGNPIAVGPVPQGIAQIAHT